MIVFISQVGLYSCRHHAVYSPVDAVVDALVFGEYLFHFGIGSGWCMFPFISASRVFSSVSFIVSRSFFYTLSLWLNESFSAVWELI